MTMGLKGLKLTQNCKAIGERDIQSPLYPTVTDGIGCARGVSSLPKGQEQLKVTLRFSTRVKTRMDTKV